MEKHYSNKIGHFVIKPFQLKYFHVTLRDSTNLDRGRVDLIFLCRTFGSASNRAKDPFKLADRVPWLLSLLPSSPLYPSIHSPAAMVGRVGILPTGLRRPTRQLDHATQ